MLPTAQTAAAPTCNFSIECREDHMDEALVCLSNAMDRATDPDAVRRNIENARAHLAAYNAWPGTVEGDGEAM